MNIKGKYNKHNKEINEISSNKSWLMKRKRYFLIFYFKKFHENIWKATMKLI
jgi:glutamate synthase domain-containing protein 1